MRGEAAFPSFPSPTSVSSGSSDEGSILSASIRRGRKLSRQFYARDARLVAKDLLGNILVRVDGKSLLAGRIVEAEAYLGAIDPASHACRGRTPRNEVMFRAGGCLYVYFTYGMHYCANVVTGREGNASAVLIRALEPVAGMKRMASNRKLSGDPGAPRMLTGGPARLCQALRIGREENGADLQGSRLFIVRGRKPPVQEIGLSRRIGISVGRGKMWRFFIRGNACLSRK